MMTGGNVWHGRGEEGVDEVPCAGAALTVRGWLRGWPQASHSSVRP